MHGVAEYYALVHVQFGEQSVQTVHLQGKKKTPDEEKKGRKEGRGMEKERKEGSEKMKEGGKGEMMEG